MMAMENVSLPQQLNGHVEHACMAERRRKRWRRKRSGLVAAKSARLAESSFPVFTVRVLLIVQIISSVLDKSLGCEADQVKVGTRTNYTCVQCAECPHGTEPSIPCGGHGPVLECTPCKSGTFSSAFDKHECRPCTICDDKLVVLQNCTAHSNSKCGGCRLGFYRHGFISDCLPCSPCCGDGQDVHPAECRTLKGMQCEKRHLDCSPGGVHAPGTTATPVSPTSTSETFPTELPPSEPWIPLEESHQTKEKSKGKSKSQAAEISVATILPVLAFGVVIAIVYKRRQTFTCFRSPVHSNDVESGTGMDMALVQPNKLRIVYILQGPRGVLRSLHDFESACFEEYERTLKRLDKKPQGKGHFLKVAKAFNIEEENIFEFEKELERENGSPSKKLLEYLAATRPNLTILDLIKVLQLPQIRREDTVEVLKPFITQSNSQNGLK